MAGKDEKPKETFVVLTNFDPAAAARPGETVSINSIGPHQPPPIRPRPEAPATGTPETSEKK